MSFGVFMHRADSIYDDVPAESYQFPRQYLGRAQACVGDWIIYLEPSKVPHTRGYFAVAKVRQVISDPSAPNIYRAIIEPDSYLDFADTVPFNGPAGIVEQGVLNDSNKVSGRAQAAVRPISPTDFARIVTLGLGEHDDLLPRIGEAPLQDLEETQAPFIYEQERVRVERLTSRVLRDRVFRRLVLDAYDRRCAITGLKLINGRGRAEVEAAHIRPVEANGPDSLHNGIALSGTAHWMFDRGLISLADDLEILISRHVNDQEGVRAMVNRTGRALAPNRLSQRPHPRFLGWHRDNCFKQ